MTRISTWAVVVVASSLATTLAWPSVELNSREYKLLLNASMFASTDQRDDTSSILMAVVKDLQKDLTQAAAGAKAVGTFGEFILKEETPRLVRFWDTPGKCLLRRNELILRMRRPLEKGGEEDPWEATLKTRNGDRYHTTARAVFVKGCNKDVAKEGKHKLEEDVSRFDWTGSTFSYSQDCQFTPTALVEGAQDNLQMVGAVWKNSRDLLENQLGLDMSVPLALVSNQTVTEVSYEDFWIYLDGDDYGGEEAKAQAKLSLWYKTMEPVEVDGDKHPLPSNTGLGDPILAELKLRIKSKHEDWTDDTIMNMHNFYEQCGKALAAKWLDPESITKTAWIYKHDPNFCDPEEDDGESS